MVRRLAAQRILIAWITWFALLAPVDLQWAAPDECPSQTEVASLLADTEEAGTLRVRAEVRPSPDGYLGELSIELDGTRFERTLEAPRCNTLVEAIRLIVAVTVDPVGASRIVSEVHGASEAPEPEPEPEPEPDPAQPITNPDPPITNPDPPITNPDPPITNPDPQPRPLPRPRPPGQLWVLLGVHGGGEVGATPGGTGSVGGQLTLDGRSWVAELGGAYWVRRRNTVERTNAGAVVGLWALVARGCWRPHRGRIDFPLCGGFEAGAMRGTAFGLVGSSARSEAWAAFVASAGLRGWIARRVRLFARLEGAAPVVSPRFENDPAMGQPIVLYEPGPLSARIQAGIEFSVMGSRPARE